MSSSFALSRFSMAWSIVTSFVILVCTAQFLAPSTSGGQSMAVLTPGFSADCKTMAKVLSPCGGTFGTSDIQVNGEYQLQQQFSGCLCKEVIQKLASNCAQCVRMAGYESTVPSPQKYLTICLQWGMKPEEWKAPYTGPVVAGTDTDLGGGPNPPAPSIATTSTTAAATAAPKPTTAILAPVPTPKPTNGTITAGTSTISNGGGKPTSSSGPNLPGSSSSSAESSVNPAGDKSGAASGLNMTAIGVSAGIIGVVIIAGVLAIVVMERRRRRSSHGRRASNNVPLSQWTETSPPAQNAPLPLYYRDYNAPRASIRAQDEYQQL